MSDKNSIEGRLIPGLPNHEVSSQGGVRRATPGKGTYVGRILKTPIDTEGYPNVNLDGLPRRIHVLIAAAFCAEWTEDCDVHHIDEDKTNSVLTNLEVESSRLAHFEKHRRRRLGLRRHGEPNSLIACACGCSTQFTKFDSSGRPRVYVSGHNYKHDAKGPYAPLPKGGEANAR